MRMTTACVGLVALVVAGCGGDDGEQTDATVTTTTTAPAPDPSTEPPGTE